MGQVRKRTAEEKKKWLRAIDAAKYTSSFRNQTTMYSRQLTQDWLHGKGHILSLMYTKYSIDFMRPKNLMALSLCNVASCYLLSYY